MNETYRVPTGFLWVAVIVLALLLIACGGGGGGGAGGFASVGSGGTGASFSGPVSGFGSIIVNGVRIDDSGATVTLDDDKTDGRNTDLRLGMMVEVEGERDSGGATGKAASITSSSFVQGPISAVNAGANQLTVLGVTVTVTPRTVYEGVTGIAALAANDTVEVHGIVNGSGGVTATRVEKKVATSEVRLTGTVQSFDATMFVISGVTVQYQPAELVDLPNGISTGMLLRVKGTLSGAAIDATRVRQVRLAPAIKEGQVLEIEGFVTRFTSATNFEVNGVAVTVPAGAKVQGTVAPGSRVEVEGTVINNVVSANKVETKDDNVLDDVAYEVHDVISNLNLLNKSFTLRNGTITVKWDSATTFDSSLVGAAAGLINGLKVEVRGKMTGNELLAARIKLDS
jgi:hypothetical protein